MKISRNWLQTYFGAPLPGADELAHALTFHAFEIDGLERHQDDDVLDVKVTPNRGHDALSHEGVAKELSAILRLPLSQAALSRCHLDNAAAASTLRIGAAPHIVVKKDAATCARFMVAHMKGVKVGPSPAWLVMRLEAIGQRSINNIVDATNYAMFSTGQPLHAFDAKTLASGEVYVLGPRMAREGESLIALDGKRYELSPERMVIAGGSDDVVLGIAGVKGGKDSGVSDATTDIIIEAATFDGVSVRKSARALDLRTDASQRFEQQLSASLPPRGLIACVELIREIAGGELVGTTDVTDALPAPTVIRFPLALTNRLLGTSLTDAEVIDALTRLSLPFSQDGDMLVVSVPPERLDLTIAEDIAEEVGRIAGLDKVPSVELPVLATTTAPNPIIATIEHVRDELLAQGYSEVYTSVFSEKGDRAVLNKVGGEKPFLRTTLQGGLEAAWRLNSDNKELLGLDEAKLFEIGSIWKGADEVIMVATIEGKIKRDRTGVLSGSAHFSEKPLSEYQSGVPTYSDVPLADTGKYRPFSRYPYIVRDIALWVPTGTSADEVLALIREHAGDLLVASYQFDSFTKGDKTSYAFRLVFQSFDRTLFDEDANTRMASVTNAVTTRGYEVR